MSEDRLKDQIFALERWRTDLTHAVQDFRQWLEQSGMATPEQELRLYEAVEMLKSDRLTIAFVAEFSRGKTELINAIFFSDYKRRLLPSTVGRTTMCPTELFYDHESQSAYIRLLPIETRRLDTSLADLKRDTSRWTTLPLDINSSNQMVEALQEVIKFKVVPTAEARALGLYDDSMADGDGKAPATVEVPVWRHALISFPHPLLKQGLVILDTPGLNALGTEPELTLSMLPTAQAVVFVLAPDTGVTRSDLDIWQFCIKRAVDQGNQQGIIAALNKIDTLWDEMMSEAEIEAAIEKQRRNTAELLGIVPEHVLPVSAQKALLAKSKQDGALLAKSRILSLERMLADEIVPAKQRIVGNRVVGEVGAMATRSREQISARFEKLSSHLDNLRSASGRNANVIKHLTHKTREQQVAYNNNMKYLQSAKRSVAQQTAAIMNELSIEAFDYLVTKTRKDMTESWTTGGLKHGMKVFFDGLHDTMEVVARQTAQTYEIVEEVYKKFHEEHGLPELNYPRFSIEEYKAKLDKLSNAADEFRNSAVTTMTEQSFVVKKFFISLVAHAREVFFQAHRESDAWLKELISPLTAQIHMHKQLLEQHLDTLCKINETREGLTKNIASLEQQCMTLSGQLDALQRIEAKLHGGLLRDETAQDRGTAPPPEPAVAN
jgi:hypothetical protein